MEPLSVLLVDDEPSMTDMMKLVLSNKAPHFSLSAANSGQECLEYLSANKVDCIISDYQMPEMDGMDLLKSIRTQGNEVPFIFFTGQGNEEVAREAFMEGANDYFTKSVGFAHFTRIINSVEQAVKQRLASEAHAKAEKEWEETFNAIDDIVTIQDMDFVILRANRAACRIFGTECKDIVGRKCYELFHGSSGPVDNCPGATLLKKIANSHEDSFSHNGHAAVLSHEIPVGDRIYEISIYPMWEIGGGFKSFVHVAKDITERKRAIENIQKTNEMLSTEFQSVHFGMMVVGKDRKIRQINRKALDMMGFGSEDEVIGRVCHETICPAQSGSCPVLDLGMRLDMSEKMIRRRDGQNIPVMKSVSIINIGGEDVLLETFAMSRQQAA